MTKNDKTTPLQAGRAYAAEHPEFEGRIEVTVVRPKGRGGWGVTRNTSTAWARDGQAVLSKHCGHPIYPSWNGHCVACGRIFLTPALAAVWRNDERAGQPLGPENAKERGEHERQWANYYRTFKGTAPEPVYAPRCTLYGVCIECRVALGMESERDEGRRLRSLETNEIVCPPAGFVPKPAPPVVVIDLTKSK